LSSVYLTFDVEDFISDNSVPALHRILQLMKKNGVTGLFFITGNMAEKLSHFPETVDLLSDHQIGYHSSSHSTYPRIFEFTDTEDYNDAYQTSLIRETANINPLTGEIQGSGGLKTLRALFPKKSIVAFRAPGYCWSPPHLEALKSLGITHDFSTLLSADPVSFHKITFYPFPMRPSSWEGGIREHMSLQRMILNQHVIVLTIHPSTMVNQTDWDLIYYPQYTHLKPNPERLLPAICKTPDEITHGFHRFDLLLKHLKSLVTMNILKVTPPLHPANKSVSIESVDLMKCYEKSIMWSGGFQYKPKFQYDHFTKFFETDKTSFSKNI
jgi:hypothetical protein